MEDEWIAAAHDVVSVRRNGFLRRTKKRLFRIVGYRKSPRFHPFRYIIKAGICTINDKPNLSRLAAARARTALWFGDCIVFSVTWPQRRAGASGAELAGDCINSRRCAHRGRKVP